MPTILSALSGVILRTRFVLFVQSGWAGLRRPAPVPGRGRADGGQTTAEYALVLLGAAAVALLLVAWATNSGKVDDLLNGVIDKILDQV